MSPETKLAPAWLRFLAWLLVTIVVTCALGVLLAGALTMDFLRWVVSGIWPMEPRHPERPGDHHPLS